MKNCLYTGLTIVLIIWICSGCHQEKKEVENRIEAKLFSIADTGWGYNIFINGKLYIHQPHIPAISGNKTFKNQEAANKTAELVIKKIKNNLMPPSVSIHELDSLEIH